MNKTEIDNIRIALSSFINVESTGQNNFHIFIKIISFIKIRTLTMLFVEQFYAMLFEEPFPVMLFVEQFPCSV
jgi:hypothetical protein